MPSVYFVVLWPGLCKLEAPFEETAELYQTGVLEENGKQEMRERNVASKFCPVTAVPGMDLSVRALCSSYCSLPLTGSAHNSRVKALAARQQAD